MTCKQHYDNHVFLVNYGKSVKSRVKKDRPFQYQGYVFFYSIAAYEIGEQEEIVDWLNRQEYESLSDEEKKDYAYFEWNEWQDWYGVYNDIVHRENALLEWFSEWPFSHFIDCSYGSIPVGRTGAPDRVSLLANQKRCSVTILSTVNSSTLDTQPV